MKRLWLRFLAFAVIFAILMTIAFLLGLLDWPDGRAGEGKNKTTGGFR